MTSTIADDMIAAAARLLDKAARRAASGDRAGARHLASIAQAMLESVAENRMASRTQKRLAETLLRRARALAGHGNGGGEPEPDGGAGPTGLDEYIERARVFVSRVEVSWDDVVGLEEAKEALLEALYYSLGEPEVPASIEVPRRFLLYGPPGTGKTLLAAAASSSLGATFIDVPVSGILSKYVGDSPKMVSAVFRLAEEEAPSIVFFDEIDALAPGRDTGDKPATGLVQALLQELDGLAGKARGRAPIVVIAATNIPWVLDRAILRRFDHFIYVPPPGREARKEIIRVHTVKRGLRLAEDVDLDWLADATEGFSGSDLARLVREATRLMLRRANPSARMLEALRRGVRPRYRVDALRRRDFEEALRRVKPTLSPRLLRMYEVFRREVGG